MQAEGEVVRLPTGPAEHGARFDTFVEEQHVRLFKALYFVTGSREEAEDIADRVEILAGITCWP
jgi:DNA-directed RNA polymerase specialized sigma24 family protein